MHRLRRKEKKKNGKLGRINLKPSIRERLYSVGFTRAQGLWLFFG